MKNRLYSVMLRDASGVIEETLEMHVPHIGDLDVDTSEVSMEADGIAADLLLLGVLEVATVVDVALPTNDGLHLVDVKLPGFAVSDPEFVFITFHQQRLSLVTICFKATSPDGHNVWVT